MDKRWIFLTDSYEGLEKTAVNKLYAVIAGGVSYVLPIKSADEVTKEELENNNIIFVGKADSGFLTKCKTDMQLPAEKEGYSIYVGESAFGEENQMVVIAGYDAAGVFYGCMDFCNKYLGGPVFDDKHIWGDGIFEVPFEKELNPWKMTAAPAIKRRAIWTWGHVIYDYRKFFENMAKLRLNEIVIWNDVAPLNAKDVVDYAHSLNIKVNWGFAWGWDTGCKNVLDRYNDQFVAEIKERVLKTYEKEYSQTGADGIYFQTFTEHSVSEIDGKPIAQIVTELVNNISASLFEKYPDLQIQFGLHATSVREKLEHIQKVDKRIQIVWEDCGSFPYNYLADHVEGFDETVAITKQTLKLRGDDEKWGAVLKGMLNLDWGTFEHFSAPYILGERTVSYIKQRQLKKDRIWKLQQAGWLKNAEYARKIIATIAKYGKEDTVVEALVEDAMLGNQITFPVALYAEMLWTPNRDAMEMVEQVAKYPCVNFSNV